MSQDRPHGGGRQRPRFSHAISALSRLFISKRSHLQSSTDNESSSNNMAKKSSEDVYELNGQALCSQCSVLPFNDKILASHVDPDQWEEILDLSATPPEHPLDYKATDYKDTDSILDLPALKDFGDRRQCPLDYRVADLLPGLPYLEQKAIRGCEFCSLLRIEILRAGHNMTGSVEITLEYHLRPTGFKSYGLAALLANVTHRPDGSYTPPASTKPNVPAIKIIFAAESDDC